jgi:membrane-associated phospholipid phosphatase
MTSWRSTAALIALALSCAAPLSAQQADSIAIAHRGVFTRGDAVAAAGIAVATAAIHPLDERIALGLQRPALQNNAGLQHTATAFRLLGSPGMLLLGGTFYVAGRVTHTRALAAAGLHSAEAIVLGEAAGGLLKWTTGRARPFTAGDTLPSDFGFLRGIRKGYAYSSFPSGHTIAAFASAAALTSEAARSWAHSGWLIGPVLYGSAGMVGLSRMYNNQHWASDVVFGAGLGTMAGLLVVRYTHDHTRNRFDRWLLSGTITPTPGGGHRFAVTILPASLDPVHQLSLPR